MKMIFKQKNARIWYTQKDSPNLLVIEITKRYKYIKFTNGLDRDIPGCYDTIINDPSDILYDDYRMGIVLK